MSACRTGTASTYLDINNVRALIPNNGGLFWQPGLESSYEVPKGGGAHSLFSASIWVGGYIEEQLHTAGSTYGPYEFWPGPLDETGRPLSDCAPFDRIWSVGREDVEYYERTGSAWTDLAEWPTGLGAPTIDAAGRLIDLGRLPLSERLGRTIDLEAGERPLVSGERTLWWVMNDADGPHEFSGSPPIGLEVQMSAFAYLGEGALANTTFYKLRIRKPAGPPLEDSFFGIFVHAQVGYFGDDYVGSDTLLGLGYAYNQDEEDGWYNRQPEPSDYSIPPAVGVDFLRGPESSGSTRVKCANTTQGDVGMTSFAALGSGSGVTGHPQSSADMYNYMTGRWKDGQRFTLGGNGRDYSNFATCFQYTGDPPGFWSQFDPHTISELPPTPETRRYVSSTGPFSLAPAEAQDILFGIITSFGVDHLDSVRQLKEDDRFVQGLVDAGVVDGPAPSRSEPVVDSAEDGVLSASFYPNPVSDVVNVKLRLPEAQVVSVSVADLIGRHRATLVSGLMEAGLHETPLDVTRWPAGVYLARIQIGSRSYSRRLVVAR